MRRFLFLCYQFFSTLNFFLIINTNIVQDMCESSWPAMDMTFQLVDMLLPVPSMMDLLITAMGRLLQAMDMDMLLPELLMVDMLLSVMDMSLPEPLRWLCSPQPWVWICFSLIRIWIGLYQNVLWWICFSWPQSWIGLSQLQTEAPWARIWTPTHRTILSF